GSARFDFPCASTARAISVLGGAMTIRLPRSAGLSRPLRLALIAVTALTAAQVLAQVPADSGLRREQARSLAESGKLAEALSIYDVLVNSGSTDVALYAEAAAAAKAAQDIGRIAAYGERQLKVDPNDYTLRQSIPIGYRLAGDEEN